MPGPSGPAKTTIARPERPGEAHHRPARRAGEIDQILTRTGRHK